MDSFRSSKVPNFWIDACGVDTRNDGAARAAAVEADFAALSFLTQVRVAGFATGIIPAVAVTQRAEGVCVCNGGPFQRGCMESLFVFT